VLASALQAAGIQAPHGGEALFNCAVNNAPAIMASGFSNINIGGILGNVANKLVLAAFKSVDTTYGMIAKQSDFSNFHQHTHYRLDSKGGFKKVSSSGELQHQQLVESNYTNQLDTEGAILSLPRKAIINDDGNALRDITSMLGRDSALAVQEALDTLVVDNGGSFYSSGNGNLIASNALNVDALDKSAAALMKQTNANGKPIWARPKLIYLPPELEGLASTIYSSQFVTDGTTKRNPSENQNRGKYKPIVSPFLSLSGLTGSSATTWFMLADPDVLPAFEVAYLNGRRVPTIETADASFNTLGIQFRGYFDFGVGQIDPSGAAKNTA